MKIALVYFSATGNTGKLAKVIAETFTGLGAETDLHDITPHAARKEKMDFGGYDAVMFGAPIHSWRAPRVFREWLATLDGAGKKGAMFFTYGGFQVHPTHYSTRNILTGQGFVVVSSAEFLASHTFNIGGWKAVPDRPDESDFAVARDYAAAIHRRFTGEDPGILGELEKTEHPDEYLDAIESFRFKVLTQIPTRNGEECSMCMACEEKCPSGAMNAETGEADPDLCIACLGCVDLCPDDALKINDMAGSFAMKMEMEKANPEDLHRKQSKIYL